MNLKLLPLLVLLWVVVGCQSNRSHHPQSQHVFAPDSLWTSSGNAQLDSLLQLAAVAPRDTNLAKLYHTIGNRYYGFDFEKAKEYYLKINTLSKQLGWRRGYYMYSSAFAPMLAREGLVDSAFAVLHRALESAKREQNEPWTAILHYSIGNIYFTTGWYETSLLHFMEALPVYEKINDIKNLEKVYFMMSQIYNNLDMVEKAIEFGEKAVALNSKDFYALFGLAKAYLSSRESEKARDYLKESLRLCELHRNYEVMGRIYYFLAEDALHAFDLEKAESYILQSKKIYEKYRPHPFFDYIQLSELEMIKGNYAQSEKYAKEALQTVIESDFFKEKKRCYMILAELAIGQHKYRENVQYRNEMDVAEKAFAKEKSITASEEMAAKYETQKKEMRIATLEKEKQLMRLLSLLGGLVLLLVLTAFFFLWRWTVQKKRTAEQQHKLAQVCIKQLEQEKQLVATQSLLEGETTERSRLARDLHDGLGSMLTGAKMNLLELKKAIELEQEEVQQFDQAVGLLDKSVQEMRRVAHHLMPDTLTRFGLKSAVNDLCLSLPSLVRFHYYGDESRLNAQIEVMIYSAILELVNNALKHAHAQNVVVQIVQDPDRIAFNVQDDGCGFDPDILSSGMGLQNVRTRVAAFNGILHIDSSAGKGTEVNVEINFLLSLQRKL